jgi:hypothetical protein
MSVFKWYRFILPVGLVAVLLSCDVAGGLLSQSELADMYEVELHIDGYPLGDGDLIRSDSSVVPVIESHGSAGSPGKLSLVLVDMHGAEAARLTFQTGSESDPDDAALRSVQSLKDNLPPFSMPKDLAEGYYTVESILFDSAGRMLSTASTLVLVYDGVLPTPRIETFPSSPSKGQPVFLRLQHGLPEERDPWLRWYIGGEVRKEGYASDLADRLVWQIPESDGFFSVRAELFPFRPPERVTGRSASTGRPRLAAFRTDLILAVGPARTASAFAGLEWIYSVDFKAEPGAQKVVAHDGTALSSSTVGSPYPEPHGSGYGHALQAGAGYLVSGSILPRDGRAFTLSMALDPAEPLGGSGSLLTLFDEDGTSVLVQFGVSAGLPYLDAGGSRVQGSTRIPAGLSSLAAEVVPAGAGAAEARVTIYLNHESVGTGVIPGRLFKAAGPVTTLIGGPGVLEGVYDELVVLNGRYQSFLVAKAHEFGSSLVAASGFEDGTLGRGITLRGQARAGDGFLELPRDSSLEIPVPAGGFNVDLEGNGADFELALVMDDGSRLLLYAAYALPGSVPARNAPNGSGTVSLSVVSVAGGLRISDAAGGNARISTAGTAVALMVQPAGPALLILQSIMVRTYSSADSDVRDASVAIGAPVEAVN